MSKVKEDLKALYKFTPNLNFDRNFFGQLILGEYSSLDQLKSKILTGKEPFELINLCEFNSKDRFKLLYRASDDGFNSQYFHSKCDGKANTLTILKASESYFIFGGFTTVNWESLTSDVELSQRSNYNLFDMN